MISTPLRLLSAVGSVFAWAVTVHAVEPPIIAKARAYLGAEAALDSVTSIHFVGTLVTADPADATKVTRAAVEILFQKPDRQRIMSTTDKTIEVTALDGYDGWTRVQDAADPAKWRQTLRSKDEIKRLRAQVWENVGFFRGIEQHAGQVEDQGNATIDGIACRKIAFIYAPNIIFYRFFDAASGRLVSTETESGSVIREQGETVVNGVRFPKTLIQITKVSATQMQTVTINFEKVLLNENLPASLFAVPPLTPR